MKSYKLGLLLLLLLPIPFELSQNVVNKTTLSVFSNDSQDNYHIMPRGTVEGSLQERFGTLWTIKELLDSSGGFISAAIGDLNNDAIIDVVVSRRQNVYAIDGINGALLWNTSVSEMGDIKTVATGDFNDDGHDDAVVGFSKVVYALNGINGDQLWTYTVYNFITSMVVSDLDRDGHDDVVVGDDLVFHTIDGEDGSHFPGGWCNPGGRIVAAGYIPFWGEYRQVIVADNEKRGVGVVYGIRYSSEIIWETSLNGQISAITVGDFDNNDDGDDFLIGTYEGGVYAIDGDSGNQIWIYNEPHAILKVATGNFNNDGIDDCLVVTDEDRIYFAAINGENGTPLWVHETQDYRSARNAYTVGDFNNDGTDDVFASPSYEWRFALIDGANGESLYTTPDEGPSHYIAVVGDFNADGRDDILVVQADFTISVLIWAVDTDMDDLFEFEEQALGTDPLAPDTDGDGVPDGNEVHQYHTNPLVPDADADTDGDGLSNVEEVDTYGTDPRVADADADADGDGLSNVEEVDLFNTNHTIADTDGDGINDGREVTEYKTDPLNMDTDGDGSQDAAEVEVGTDPLNPLDPPAETSRVPEFTFELVLFSVLVLLGLRKRRTS